MIDFQPTRKLDFKSNIDFEPSINLDPFLTPVAEKYITPETRSISGQSIMDTLTPAGERFNSDYLTKPTKPFEARDLYTPKQAQKLVFEDELNKIDDLANRGIDERPYGTTGWQSGTNLSSWADNQNQAQMHYDSGIRKMNDGDIEKLTDSQLLDDNIFSQAAKDAYDPSQLEDLKNRRALAFVRKNNLSSNLLYAGADNAEDFEQRQQYIQSLYDRRAKALQAKDPDISRMQSYINSLQSGALDVAGAGVQLTGKLVDNMLLTKGIDKLTGGELSKWFDETARTIHKAQGEPEFATKNQNVVDWAVNNTLQTAPFIMATIASGGSTGAMFVTAFAVEGNGIYQDGLDQGMSQNEAALRGIIGGALNAGIELGGGSGAKYLKEAALNKAVSKIAKAKAIGIDAIKTGLKEGLQEELPQELVSMVMGGTIPLTGNGDVDWEAVSSRLTQAAVGGMLAGSLLRTVSVPLTDLNADQKQQQLQQDMFNQDVARLDAMSSPEAFNAAPVAEQPLTPANAPLEPQTSINPPQSEEIAQNEISEPVVTPTMAATPRTSPVEGQTPEMAITQPPSTQTPVQGLQTPETPIQGETNALQQEVQTPQVAREVPEMGAADNKTAPKSNGVKPEANTTKLTKAEKERLRVMGYNAKAIRTVKPEEARDLLKQIDEMENDIPIVPDKHGGFVRIPKDILGIGKIFGDNSTYTAMFDRFEPITQIVKKAKSKGAIIEAGKDASIRARQYLGIAGKVKSVLMDKTFRIKDDGNIEVTGEGLKPILDDFDTELKVSEKSAGVRKQDLNSYLIARRTIEDLQRPAEPGGANITTPQQVAEAQATLAKLNAKYGADIQSLEKAADRLYAYQKRVLHLLVESGNLSQEQYNDIVAKNQHYIPFDRILDADEKTGGIPKGRGIFSGVTSGIRRIKGSDKKIHEVLESVVKNTYQVIDRAERNTVARAVSELSPILPDDIKPRKGNSLYKPRGGNIVEYYDNGKVKYVEVSKQLASAMNGLNEMSLGIFTKLLSIPKKLLTKGATLVPEFALRNPIKDQLVGHIQTQVGFRPFVDSSYALANILGRTDLYYDWLRSGGANAGLVELNRDALANAVEELDKHHRLLSKFKYLLIVPAAEEFSQLTEQSTRVGVFKAAKRSGLSDIEAGFQSRDATTDFARHGNMTSDADAVIAFLRASMQAFDKTIRNARANPVSTTIKGIAAITLPSILLYLLHRDDDEYKKIPQWQKDLFWIVKIGDTYVRVPKPFLYGQVFGTLPERFLTYADGKDPGSLKSLVTSLVTSASPVTDPTDLVPTALMPLIENMANYNVFRDEYIVPQGKQDELPQYQSTAYTSETAKLLGEALKYSPAKIENLMQGYLGGSSGYILDAGDLLINGIRAQAGVKVTDSPKAELADIPVVRGFVVRPPDKGSNQVINDFYANVENVSMAHNSYREMQKTGNKAKADKIANDYPYWSLGLEAAENVTAMSQLNKQIQAMQKMPIPENTKEARLRVLREQRSVIAERFNAKLKQYKPKSTGIKQ